MARSRNIKPGLFKNEILGEADPIYTLLFAGLWTLADKDGRLEYRPKKIKAELFPYRFDLDISTALAWLKHESFITVYGIDQDSYIQINNWKRHQNPHHKEVDSTIPTIEEIEKQNKKQQLAQEQAKHEPSMNQDQSKQIGSCPTDSLNLIPDSLNSDSLNPGDPTTSDLSTAEPVDELGAKEHEPEKPPPCPHQEIIALYKRILPELPGVTESLWAGSKREINLRARWKQSEKHQTLDFWERFFTAIRQIDWYFPGCGNPGIADWSASLPWLIEKENFIKTIERLQEIRNKAA